MNYCTAVDVWDIIRKSSLTDLREDMVEQAIRYARKRVDYILADAEQRMVMDADRTASHNALITSFDILARHMAHCGEDAAWREQLGKDRKVIGDFACFLHAILGISAG